MDKKSFERGFQVSSEFRKFFWDLPIASLIWKYQKGDFKLITFNHQALNLTRNEIKNYKGVLASEFYKETPKVRDNLEKCFTEHKTIKEQGFFKLRSTGEIRYLNATYSYVPPDRVFIHIKDISEYKSIEKKLKEKKENFEILYEHIPGGILLVNEDYQIVDVNERACEISGFSKEELIGGLCDLLCPKGSKSKECPIWEKNIDSFKNMDTMIKCKDDSLNPIIKNANKIEIDDVPYILESFQDISEQKNLEEELMESKKKLEQINNKLKFLISKKSKKLKKTEERFNQLFDKCPFYICILDFEGKIIDCNDSIENFFLNLKRKELIERNIEDVFSHDPNLKKISFKFQELAQTFLKGERKEHSGEFFIKKDSKKIWIQFFSSIISIGGKDFIQFIMNDITEKINALEELQKSEKAYKEAYNKAEFYKNLFIHDINSIFQNIKSSIQLSKLFLKSNEIDKISENYEIIENQFARIDKLVSNVRNLYKLESESFEIYPIDVYKILKRSVEFVKTSFYNRKMEIEVDIDDVLRENKSAPLKIEVRANDLLVDVCENILMNAVKYNDNEIVKVRVKISKFNDDGRSHIKLEFKDNGIGIREARREEIFQESWDIHDTSKKGLGFGLTLIKKVIESYNGKIWVENRIPEDFTKGANFVVLIPHV